MVIKIYYYKGVKKYCKDPFNVFDAVLVIVSLIDLALSEYGSSIDGFSAIIVFKALRLLRVFKLAKRSENI